MADNYIDKIKNFAGHVIDSNKNPYDSVIIDRERNRVLREIKSSAPNDLPMDAKNLLSTINDPDQAKRLIDSYKGGVDRGNIETDKIYREQAAKNKYFTGSIGNFTVPEIPTTKSKPNPLLFKNPAHLEQDYKAPVTNTDNNVFKNEPIKQDIPTNTTTNTTTETPFKSAVEKVETTQPVNPPKESNVFKTPVSTDTQTKAPSDETSSPETPKSEEVGAIGKTIGAALGGTIAIGGVPKIISGIGSLFSGGSSVSKNLESTASGGDSGVIGEGHFGGEDSVQGKSAIEVLSKIYAVLTRTKNTIDDIARDTSTLVRSQSQQNASSDINAANLAARQNEGGEQTASPVVVQGGGSNDTEDDEDEDKKDSVEKGLASKAWDTAKNFLKKRAKPIITGTAAVLGGAALLATPSSLDTGSSPTFEGKKLTSKQKDNYDRIIQEAQKQGLSQEQTDGLLALAWHESHFNDDARGILMKSGTHEGDRAHGTFQYMAKSSKGWNRDDPAQNIAHGVSDFKKHSEQFGGNLGAFAAHHAGPGAVNPDGTLKRDVSDGNEYTSQYQKRINNIAESLKKQREASASKVASEEKPTINGTKLTGDTSKNPYFGKESTEFDVPDSEKLDAPKYMIREAKLPGEKSVNWKVDLESGEETLATEEDIRKDKEQKETEKKWVEEHSNTKVSTTGGVTTKTADPVQLTDEQKAYEKWEQDPLNNPDPGTKYHSKIKPQGYLEAKDASLEARRNAVEKDMKANKISTDEANKLYDDINREQNNNEWDKMVKADATATPVNNTNLDGLSQQEKDEAASYKDKVENSGLYKKVEPTKYGEPTEAGFKMVDEVDRIDKRKSELNEELTQQSLHTAYPDKESMEKDLHRLDEIFAEQHSLNDKRNDITATDEWRNASHARSQGQTQAPSQQKQAPPPPKNTSGTGKSVPSVRNDDPTIKMMEEGNMWRTNSHEA